MPDGRSALIVNAGGGAITMVKGSDFVCTGVLESLTVAVKFAVPLAVGVPEMTPVPEPRTRPVGRLPAMDQVYGAVPPVAVSPPL